MLSRWYHWALGCVTEKTNINESNIWTSLLTDDHNNIDQPYQSIFLLIFAAVFMIV